MKSLLSHIIFDQSPFHLCLCPTSSTLRKAGEHMTNRVQLKAAAAMLLQLGVERRSVYEDEFEIPFLDQSRSFFRVCLRSSSNIITLAIPM